MLKAKRIDAMLGFPVEVKYYAMESGIDYHDFEVIPVSGMVPYSAVYFGAPKNEWGKYVIDKLNKLLLEEGTIPQYIKYYESWLSDDSEITRYRAAIEDYYGKKYPTIYKNLLNETSMGGEP